MALGFWSGLNIVIIPFGLRGGLATSGPRSQLRILEVRISSHPSSLTQLIIEQTVIDAMSLLLLCISFVTAFVMIACIENFGVGIRQYSRVFAIPKLHVSSMV